MARVEVRRSEVVGANAAVVLDAVDAACRQSGCRTQRVDGSAIEIRRGSQLRTRLLGGWFISIKYLPVAADVEIRPVSAGTAIEVHARDTLGFGFRVGMNERLTGALDDLADLVINAGRSVLG